MTQPDRFCFFLLLLMLCSFEAICEEIPSEELLIFLATYTDKDGNWDAPPLEEDTDEDSDEEGKTHE